MPQPQPTARDPRDLRGLRAFLYYRVSRDDSGEEKSTKDQKAEAHQWANREGVIIAGEFEDVSLSASSFARKERPGYKRLLAAIENSDVDLVWFWALNRATRQAREYLDLAELCEPRGVRWVVGGKLYDLSDDDDTIGLDLHNIMDRRYSRKLSKDVRRGKLYGAKAGRPAGRQTYGYRRVYDTTVIPPRYLRSEPNVYDGDGPGLLEDSPAWVVRQIFTRIAAGASLHSIRRDLDARGVPTPSAGKPSGGTKWHIYTIRYIATNPAYIARRQHGAKDPRVVADRRRAILDDVETTWDRLVEDDLFWTVQRILDGNHNSPGPRPGAGNALHLLSGLAHCGACGAPMQAKMMPGRPGKPTRHTYGCTGSHYCTTILEAAADQYVSVLAVRRLEDPELLADLTGGGSDVARQARADAEQLRTDLAEWRSKARAGEVSASFYAEIEQDRLARIAEAERREQAATIPVHLRGNTGPGAAQRWLKMDLAERRQIIRQLMGIKVHKAGSGSRATAKERMEIAWLGPDGEPTATIVPDLTRASMPAKIRDRVLELRAQGASYSAIAAELGVAKMTAWKAANEAS